MLDEITVAMLKKVLRDSATRGLIVLTINTDTPMGKGTGAGSSQSLARWLDEEEHANRLTTITLDPMTPAELTEVAVQHLDLREPSQADMSALATVITTSQGHPGRLVRFLDVPSIRTAVTGGGDLPADLESLTDQGQERQLFQVLPHEARQALATASLPGPVVPGRWLTSRPPGTLDGARFLTQSEVDAAIATGWVELDSAGMLRFISDTAHRITFRAMPAELTPDRQRQILNAIGAWVDAAHNDHSWSDLPPSVRESLLTALTADNAQHLGFELMPAWQAELMRLRRVTGRIAIEEASLVQLEERLRTGIPSTLLVVATAEALLDAGHNQRALDVLQAELDRLSAKHGTGAAPTLPALANLAAARAEMARRRQGHPEARALFDHAIALYRELLQGRLKHLARTNVRILNTRHALATLLADAYRFAEAADEAGTCVQEMKNHPNYGPDHPETLGTRSDLASWTGQAGDVERARDLLQALLRDDVDVLGPDHPETLLSRGNFAFWTGEAGDAEQARHLLATLLPDYVRVLGPDHPETLSIRSNLAVWTGEAGDAERARHLLATLLPDRERILGPDHPDTLTTRNNLAAMIGQAGDVKRARDLFADLLSDRERILGPDHFETLTTRNNLAAWTGEAGDAERARDLFADLLPDRERILGPDHPATLATRRNLAFWSRKARNGPGPL
jgi:predicted component of type VI protein secretion system